MIISDYDINKFNFIEIITNLFSIKLENIHTLSDQKYDLFEVGDDSKTIFHKQFYHKYRSGWAELQEVYDAFIKQVVASTFTENILYQKFPTFRVHLPGNVAVGAFHNDAEFNHPEGEINYIIPLTNSKDTASVWVEYEPGTKDFYPMDMNVGELIKFNGNKLTHGNKVNETKKTRVSIDFRILPESCYDAHTISESITTKTKFIEGKYYSRLKI